jgi:hypothetical protein
MVVYCVFWWWGLVFVREAMNMLETRRADDYPFSLSSNQLNVLNCTQHTKKKYQQI